MPEAIIHPLVRLAYLYLLVGLALLPWWHGWGLKRLDAAAGAGPWGFRVLVSFGLVALWPLLLPRALRGGGHPPQERNAHRLRAQREEAR